MPPRLPCRLRRRLAELPPSCPICRSRVSPEDVLLLHRESAEPEAVPKPPGRRISGRHSSAGENSSGTGVRFAVRRPSESGAAAALSGFDLERQRKDGLLLPMVQQSHRVVFHDCEGAQERWSDLRPSDLMLLRSGTMITSSGRFSAICTGDGRRLNWSRRSASAAIEERPFGEERTMRKWLWFTAKRTVRWIGGGQESGG
ncbi:hypothetical protein HPP92_027660 [Vanilla planifolia]|uniref:Uncharacterized protein n=1 Tax=Vanilla planifolia TaxID=51239 RepID=A0A835PC16_VANPL|nr:hypothetical protein HPP92_027660 [Vanilla planifolia]